MAKVPMAPDDPDRRDLLRSERRSEEYWERRERRLYGEPEPPSTLLSDALEGARRAESTSRLETIEDVKGSARDVWEGIKATGRALSLVPDPERSILSELGTLGKAGLGALTIAGSPVSYAIKTGARTLPYIAEETTDSEMPPLAKKFLAVGEFVGEMAVPAKAGTLLLRKIRQGLTNVKALPGLGDFERADEFARNVFDMPVANAVKNGWIEVSERGGYRLTSKGAREQLDAVDDELIRRQQMEARHRPKHSPEGRELPPGPSEPKALPPSGRVGGPAVDPNAVPPEPTRVFKVGPPGSVTGKPVEAVRETPTRGGYVKDPATVVTPTRLIDRLRERVGRVDRREGESALDYLRRTADPGDVTPETSKLPGWVQTEINRQVSNANRLGIADDIEELSAQGLVARQVAQELVKKYGQAKFGKSGTNEIVDIVRSVRANRGIPGQEQKTEFAEWITKRSATREASEQLTRDTELLKITETAGLTGRILEGLNKNQTTRQIAEKLQEKQPNLDIDTLESLVEAVSRRRAASRARPINRTEGGEPRPLAGETPPTKTPEPTGGPEKVPAGGKAGPPKPPTGTGPRTDIFPDDEEPFKAAKESFVSRFGKKSRTVKALSGITSPTEVARGDPALEKLVQLRKDATRKAGEYADRWVSLRDEAFEAAGSEQEFSRLMRIRDREGPLAGVTPAQQKINEFYSNVSEALGQGPNGTNIFHEGWLKKLKQNVRMQHGKLVDTEEYTTTDLNKILQSTEAGKVLVGKLGSEGDLYSFAGISKSFRAAARKAVLGGKNEGGFLQEIQPLLQELRDRPESIRRFVDDYVDYFIGAPGTRSISLSQRLADASRTYQFIRTLGGNITSSGINLLQQTLTLAETNPKSFTKAYQDLIRYAKKDESLMKLLDEAGLKYELQASGLASDLGQMPAELLSWGEQWLRKTSDAVGIPFRATEKWNRAHAFLSGFYDAQAKGLSRADAITHGKHIMDKTQFTGGEADMPSWFRGATGGAIGQFKTFMIKYGEYIKNNAGEAARAAWDTSLPASERKAALARFAKFWGSQAAIGGTQAIPGGTEFFEEHVGRMPLDMHQGVAGMLGISLENQIGLGVLPIEKIRDFYYQVPGPTLSMLQDMASLGTGVNRGTGMDLSRFGEPLTEDERAQRIARLGIAGTQVNRLREAFQNLQTGGPEAAANTMLEAWGIQEPTGDKLYETVQGPVRDVLGLRSTAREREIEIRDKIIEERADINRVKERAASLGASGNKLQQRRLLQQVAEKYGIDPSEMWLTDEALDAALRRKHKATIERFRDEPQRGRPQVPSPY